MDYTVLTIGLFLNLLSIVRTARLQEFVHGLSEGERKVTIHSPNHYYLLYKNIQVKGDQDVILKHPALPVRGLHQLASHGRLKAAADCSSMRDPHQHMNEEAKTMMCEMYKQWTDSMRSDHRWAPTPSQHAWWDSLGMKRRSSYRSNGRRTDRQMAAADRSTRKEYRAMTDDERHRFHRAANALKEADMDGQSKYDVFVHYHQAQQSPGAHFGPGFYGWHREMLFRFENALREIDPGVNLPYWDSNLDFHLGDDLATKAVTWTPHFLGNGQGTVIDGPFAHWTMPYAIEGRTVLFRNLTNAPMNARTEPSLMSHRAMTSILEAQSFRDLTWFVDSEFESHHGALHNWVGGTMANLPISPADPVFFLHHAFIDCLWEQFRRNQRRSGVDPRYNYPNDSLALGVGQRQPDGTVLQHPEDSPHFSLSIMHPFGPMKNIDAHMDEYFNEFYTCSPSPTCSQQDSDCGSKYLFCDIQNERCVPKLQIGAQCGQYRAYDPCFQGICCNEQCHRKCNELSHHENRINKNVDEVRKRSHYMYVNERDELRVIAPHIENVHISVTDEDDVDHYDEEHHRRVNTIDVQLQRSRNFQRHSFSSYTNQIEPFSTNFHQNAKSLRPTSIQRNRPLFSQFDVDNQRQYSEHTQDSTHLSANNVPATFHYSYSPQSTQMSSDDDGTHAGRRTPLPLSHLLTGMHLSGLRNSGRPHVENRNHELRTDQLYSRGRNRYPSYPLANYDQKIHDPRQHNIYRRPPSVYNRFTG